MKKTAMILMTLAALLSCAEDEGEVQRGPEWLESRQGLVYSYPAEGQSAVPVSAPVVLRFTSEVVDSFPEDSITLERIGDGEQAFSLEQAGGGRTLVLTPEDGLAPLAQYQLSVEGLSLADGAAAAQSLTFTTAGLSRGPRSLVDHGGDFRLLRRIPDGDRFPYLDFSSLRLQFSRSLDPASVRYGDSLRLEGPGGLVEAQLLVKGSRVTLDPDQDLGAGETYTLILGTGIRDKQGEAFAGNSHDFVPRDSGSRSVLVQQLVDSGGGALRSKLTGEPLNQVPLQAVLLGEDNASQQSGDLAVELAHIPSFPQTAPLRIRRGTLLRGSEMEVLIGGAVPAGFDSGDVGIRFVSDAMGYMFANPWSTLPEAPRQIVLFMDVAISTGEPRASGAVTQELLHLELVGTAIVEEGELVVDAVGVVEPEILGVETARSLLSFHMRSYVDQQNAPTPAGDQQPPELDSWIPGDQPEMFRAEDSVVLQFSEPLDSASVRPGDTLTLTNSDTMSDVPFRHHRDGAALVIEPEQPLEYDTDYRIRLDAGITDTVGNPLAGAPLTRDFRLPVSVLSNIHAPMVLSVHPGFPCLPEDFDLDLNDAGRCQGGAPDDDHMPLARHPANRSLRVTFSAAPEPASVNNDTFTVERVDAAGDAIEAVAGQLRLRGRELSFVPAEPWQPGELYRYTLHSRVSGPDCGTDAICAAFGPAQLPLQTRLLAQSPEDAPGRLQGGPDLPVFFRAVEEAGEVNQLLGNLPTADVNANFVADAQEPVPSLDPDAQRNSTRILPNPAANPGEDGTAASGTAVADINVGCGFDGDDNRLHCPDQKFGFINGSLEVDVAGYVPPEEIDQSDPEIPPVVRDDGGVLVYIHPTRVLQSSIVVHPLLTEGADMLNFETQPAPTGPQLMRIRYSCDAATDPCEGPDYGRVRGWIVEEGGTARLLAELDLYLDAPRLDPVVKNHNFDPPQDVAVAHDMRSLPLSLSLSGEVSFLDDGRLRIEQLNAGDIDVQVHLDIENGLLESDLFLVIPAGDARLDYVSRPPAR